MSPTKVAKTFQKFLSIVGMAVIAVLFLSLGLWQWNRAQENRKPVAIDQKLVLLESVAQPRTSLTSRALLRQVSVEGKYIAVFEAPNQVENNGRQGAWEVGLLQTKSDAAILVVRGLWSDRNISSATSLGSVVVEGSLFPHQSEDYSEGRSGTLQRIDSSVIVDQTSADLFDGYIVARSEMAGDTNVDRVRIDPPAPRSAVPGFYWQHISYVIIWWLMAAIVLYLPFYQRRVTQESQSENQPESQV